MFTIADIIYSDGFIRLSSNNGRYYICQAIGEDVSTTETTYDDIITTLRESREESTNCECTICIYSQSVCFA